jgi:hypothetical protein
MDMNAGRDTEVEFFVGAKKNLSLQHPTTQHFRELRAFHSTLETIVIDDLPLGSVRARALLA